MNESEELIHIHIGGEEIIAPPNQPFWVEGRGFTAAVCLKPGDRVETTEGEILTITRVEREVLDAPIPVYNFEVEDWHTYYVSEEKVLVHNMCWMDVGIKGVTDAKKVPNPYGRKGGIAHQSMISSIKPSKVDRRISYEVKFDTPNGSKNYRFADAVEIYNGQITSIHQVGKVNKNGTLVMRESQAIADIMSSPGYKGVPIYFWPYNSDLGPIIFNF